MVLREPDAYPRIMHFVRRMDGDDGATRPWLEK